MKYALAAVLMIVVAVAASAMTPSEHREWLASNTQLYEGVPEAAQADVATLMDLSKPAAERKAAAERIGALGNPAGRGCACAVAGSAHKDPDAEVRAASCTAFGSIMDETFVRTLRRKSVTPSPTETATWLMRAKTRTDVTEGGDANANVRAAAQAAADRIRN